MDKRFWAIIGVIAAVFLGILWVQSNNKASAPSTSAQPTNHLYGKKDSPVKFVEYGDFQCPYCGQYYPIIREVVSKYATQISFQFINYPLTQVHQNAVAAARAAEAADEQGKFWEMYDMLYQNQQDWSESTSAPNVFEGYAKQFGLNTTKFKADFASSKVNNRINADKEKFDKLGLEKSTPTFLLNGKKITATNAKEFSKLIDAELAKQQKSGSATTTPSNATDTPAAAEQPTDTSQVQQ
jgi:protein-disulfide isomerase